MTDAQLSPDLADVPFDLPPVAGALDPQNLSHFAESFFPSAPLPPAAVRALVAADDLGSVVRALADAAASVGRTAAALVWDDEGGRPLPIATAGTDAEFLRRVLEADRDIRLALRHAAERDRGMFETRDLADIARRALQPLPVRSGVAARLSVAGAVDGMVALLCATPTPLPAQIDTVTNLADLGAVAARRAIEGETRLRRERREARRVVRATLRLLGADPGGESEPDTKVSFPTEDELRPHVVARAIADRVGCMADLPVYLDRVATDVARLAIGARCRLAVPASGGDVVVVADTEPGTELGARVGPDRALGRAAALRTVVNEPGASLGGVDGRPGTWTSESGLAELAVPIDVGRRVIGVVGLERDLAAGPPFSAVEADALGFVARRLAPALQIALHHDELKRAASTDGLTRLANHRVFYRSLEEELDRAVVLRVPLRVVLFDIDGLKQVNDTRGHLAGDALLRQFARLLEANVRAGDVVARYGGDEFAVVMPGAGTEQARSVGMRVRRALRKRSLTSPVLRPVAVTYGVATAPSDGAKAAELVATADHRLYAARGRRSEQPPAR